MVPLYVGIVTLAVWGPFPRSFDPEARVFTGWNSGSLEDLITSAKFPGEKEDPTRTAYVVRASPASTKPGANVGMMAFPQEVFGEKPSDLQPKERGVTLPQSSTHSGFQWSRPVSS